MKLTRNGHACKSGISSQTAARAAGASPRQRADLLIFGRFSSAMPAPEHGSIPAMATAKPDSVENSRLEQRLSRHRDILAIVAESGIVSLADLAARMDVSQETIRRDIRELDRQGRVRRVHGGVTTLETGSEPGFQVRLRDNEEAKKRIARAFADMVRHDDSLIFGTGSTVFLAAQALRAHRALFAITNSVEIARLFIANRDHKVIMAGGELRAGDGAALGPQAISFVDQFRVRWAVVSADGIDSDGAISVLTHADAEYLRHVMGCAEQTALLITGDKINRRSLIQIGNVQDFQVIICDKPMPSRIATIIEAGKGTAVEAV